MKRIALVALMLASSTVFAGAKGDFIAALKAQCGKDDAAAAALASSPEAKGRAGTVVRFKVCAEPTVDVGGGCRLKCSKGGNTIGG